MAIQRMNRENRIERLYQSWNAFADRVEAGPSSQGKVFSGRAFAVTPYGQNILMSVNATTKTYISMVFDESGPASEIWEDFPELEDVVKGLDFIPWAD